MNERVRTLLAFHFRSWLRSRGPLLWLLFLGAWGWFNWEVFRQNSEQPWWAAWSVLAAWLGFLAGYDTYARMREDGTLRLILLHPPRRVELAVSFWIGSVLLVGSALLLFLTFLGSWREVPLGVETARAMMLTVLTGGAFIGYAQIASLVLPRDTSAVLGLVVVILGGTPLDRWVPSTVPDWLEGAVWALHLVLPTSNRLSQALAAPSARGALIVLMSQIAVSLAVITLLLHWKGLTRRAEG